MPRVQINNRKYKEQDLNQFIKSRCVASGVMLKDLARELGMARTSMYERLKSGRLSYGELLVIIDALKLSDTEILNLMKLSERTRK